MMQLIRAHYHPLYTATAGSVLGIITEYYIQNQSFVFISALSIFLGLLFLIPHLKISLIIVSLAFTCAFWRAHDQKKKFYDFYNTHKKISIIGTITDIEEQVNKSNRCSITIETSSLLLNNEWTPSTHTIRLYTGLRSDIMVGDIIQANHINVQQGPNSSFTHYLIKEGILLTSFIKRNQCFLLERPRYSSKRWLHEQRKQICSSIKNKLSVNTYALFLSLFLGNKQVDQTIIQSINNQFKYWGILHYLARSGLHLVIFIFIWNFFASFIPCRLWIKQIFLILLTIVYFIMSWSSISFLRAYMSLIMHKICAILKLPTHNIYLIVLLFFIYILKNPAQLFYLDFQLSFSLTWGLMLINRLLAQQNQTNH